MRKVKENLQFRIDLPRIMREVLSNNLKGAGRTFRFAFNETLRILENDVLYPALEREDVNTVWAMAKLGIITKSDRIGSPLSEGEIDDVIKAYKNKNFKRNIIE